MELLGALIGARLGNYLSKILSLNNVNCNFWTDSMITIHWIKSTAKQWKPFVANRVAEILRCRRTGDTAREKKILLIMELVDSTQRHLQLINCGGMDRVGYTQPT